MPDRCETCGRESSPGAERSNASPVVYLPVPEEMIPFVAGVLRQASTRAGMHGYGIAANMIQDFAKPLQEVMPEHLRAFTWEPEGFAEALYAHDIGRSIVITPDPEKRRVHIVSFGDDERGRVHASRTVRPDQDLSMVVEALEALFERRERKIPEPDPAPER